PTPTPTATPTPTPTCTPAGDWALPDDRRPAVGTWVNAGVPGGFEQYRPGGANQRTTLIDVTDAPYNADNSGATDASAAINAAVVGAANNSVVYLPTGTYRLDSAISINRSNITVRGDGPADTILLSRTGSAFVMEGAFSRDFTASVVNSGLTGGSTSCVVA